jgi:hypothetical protein
MLNNINNSFEQKQKTLNEHNSTIRKPYHKPHLEKLGDLRALTFGSFPGFTDSGGYSAVDPF